MNNNRELLFTKLFNQTHGKAFNFVFSLCEDKELTYDIVQTAYIKVWRQIDKFERHPNPEALLFVTVKNIFLDEIKKYNKKRSLHVPVDQVNNNIPIDYETGQELNYRETKELISNAIEKLPYTLKKVYKMYFFDELTVLELAQQLQLSQNTIRTHIETAERFLRQELKILR